MVQVATVKMTEKVTCPNERCFWHWRHYEHETLDARRHLRNHLRHCPVSYECPTCGAQPGKACITRGGKTTHCPHIARRYLRDKEAYAHV